MKKVYTALIVDAVTRPPNLGWLIFAGELIVWIIEIGVVAGYDMLIMGYDKDRLEKVLPASLLIYLARIGQIDTMISTIEESVVVWFLVVTTISLVVLIFLSLYIEGNRIRNEHDRTIHRTLEEEWKNKSIGESVLYLYFYIFYPVLLVANACFLCNSQLISDSLTSKTSDMIDLQNLADVYYHSSEKKYELVWRYDSTQKCFSGLHVVMSILGSLLHCLNALMLTLHHKVTSFYPNPRIRISKRNQLWLIHPLFILSASLAKNLIISFKATSHLGSYFTFSLSIPAFLILVDLFSRPFYYRKLNVVKAIQKLCSISIGAFIFYTKAYGIDRKPYFLLLFLCLTIMFFFIIKLILIKGFQQVLPTAKLFSLENLKVGDLIYSFEKLKIKICQGSDTAMTKPDSLNIIREIYALYSRHKESCAGLDCFCREHGIDIWTYKLDRLFHKNYPEWFRNILYITNYLIETRYDLVAYGSNLKSSKNLYLLRLWSMFGIQNFGNTSKILTTIKRIEYHGGKNVKNMEKKINRIKVPFAKENESKNQIEDIFKKWRSIDLGIIKKLVSEEVEKFNSTVSLGYWESAFGLAEIKGLKDRVNSAFAILCINRLEELGFRMEDALIKKTQFVQKVVENSQALIQHSTEFLDSTDRVDQILLLLSHCKLEHSFKLNFLEIFFNLFIREDFHKAWLKVKVIDSKHLTSNMISTIKFEGTDRPDCQMVFIGISGEQANLHTINHITVNIELLGFSLPNILHRDLESILPNYIVPNHKSLFSKGVPRQHLLQNREAYQLFIKEASGVIRDASVVLRTNDSLYRGLEYLAFSSVSTSETSYLFLVIDNKGKITDVNTAASKYFRPSDNFEYYNSDLTSFIEEYKDTINLSKCKPLPFANASLLSKKRDLVDESIEAEDIFKCWFILPIRPQKRGFSFQLYFKAKLVPLNFKELGISTFSLQLEKLKGLGYENDEIEETYVTESNLKSKPISDDSEEDYDSFGKSSIHAKQTQPKKTILKNAQQTDEYKMQSTGSLYRPTPLNKSVGFKSEHLPLTKKITFRKKDTIQKKKTSDIATPSRTVVEIIIWRVMHWMGQKKCQRNIM